MILMMKLKKWKIFSKGINIMRSIINKFDSLVLFNIGYISLLISDMCLQVECIRLYDMYISFIGYLLIAIYLLINIKKFLNMNRKHFLYIIVSCLVLLVSFIFSGNFTIIRLIMLGLSIMTMNFDGYVQNDVLYKSIIIVVLMMLSMLGFVNNRVVYRDNLTMRYSYGFEHPNILSMYLSLVVFEVTYLLLKNKKNIKTINKVLILLFIPLAIFFMAIVTDTKTSVIILLVFYLVIISYLFLYKILLKVLNNKIIKNILMRLFLLISIMLVVTIILAYSYPEILSFLDRVFSQRYSYYIVYLNTLGINGLGGVVPNSINLAVLDNMYLKIFLSGGVILYFTYYMLFYMSAKKAYKNKNYILIFIISTMCFVGFVETNVLMPTLNIFILYCLSDYFLKK